MMFIILDSCPIQAVYKLPEKIRFKQLIELAQLICSAGFSDVYKKIPQGKNIQQWIKKYPTYTFRYFRRLLVWCSNHTNMSIDTEKKLHHISLDLSKNLDLYDTSEKTPTSAVFRYAKNYKSIYPTNTEICIGNAIKAYEEYMEWKNYDQNKR